MRHRQVTFVTMAILLTLSAGFSAALFRTNMVAAPVLAEKVFGVLSGRVISISASEKKSRLLLDKLDLNSGDTVPDLRQTRITVRKSTDHIKPGMRVRMKVFLLPPSAPAYPGAFDFQRDAFFKRIGAVGYAVSEVEILQETNDQPTFTVFSSALRDFINDYVYAHAPSRTAGFSVAIMTGDRAGLLQDDVEAMRQSGLAHLLAISGLHMGMVGGLIFFLTRLILSFFPALALNYPIKKWAALIAILGLGGYLMVSGGSVSALRAFIMITMVFLAMCFDRTAISMRNLAMAAFFILIFYPESLLSAGFQMSFAAVFCLIAFYERFGQIILVRARQGGLIQRIVFYFAGILLTSLIASFATAPFAVYHFGQFSSLGILANLVAVPIMGLWVMPWTVFSFILLPFFDVAFPLELAAYGIEAILMIAHWTREFPGAYLEIGTVPDEFLYLSTIAVLWSLIWRGKIRFLALFFFLIACFSLFSFKAPDLLIAQSGKLILVRAADQKIYVSTYRSERFERERWRLLYQMQEPARFSDRNSAVKCDEAGCIFKKEGLTAAFSRNLYSLKEDCMRADIVISDIPVSANCIEPELIIDYWDLEKEGTHALYLADRAIERIETVNGIRGRRPWVP
ncbi:MAG: ComEC family competence protein [Sneathiellales bacterium]|nr:ComEC family competence protein [Sneathiellales bacterium]